MDTTVWLGLVGTTFGGLVALASSVLVYRANKESVNLERDRSRFEQHLEEVEALRTDIREADVQRREDHVLVARLLRQLTAARLWAYYLAGLLAQNGIPYDPEPIEVTEEESDK